jgi:hypothetical protein
LRTPISLLFITNHCHLMWQSFYVTSMARLSTVP